MCYCLLNRNLQQLIGEYDYGTAKKTASPSVDLQEATSQLCVMLVMKGEMGY